MIRITLEKILAKTDQNISRIARETGINRNTLQSIVLGKSSGVQFETLDILCRTYGVKLEDLFIQAQPASSEALEGKLYRQEAEAVLFTLLPPAQAVVDFSLPHRRESGFGSLWMYCKDKYLFGFWEEEKMRTIARGFYEYYCDSQRFDILYGEFLSHSAVVESFYRRAYDGDIAHLDATQLLKLFGEVRAASAQFWMTSIFIDGFDVGVDQELIAEITQKVGLSAEDVHALTTPSEMTFLTERKFALHKIFASMGKKTWTEDLIRSFVSSSSDVRFFKRDFDYVDSNYATVKHQTDEQIVAELWRMHQDVPKTLSDYRDLQRYVSDHEASIAAVVKKYKLGKNPLWFFERLTIWREYRKKVNLMSIHVYDAILERIEAIVGIPKKYLQYLTLDEVPNVLRGLLPLEELRARREEGVMVIMTRNGYELLHGKQAESLLRELNDRLITNNTAKIINGQTASQGYAKGIARVVLNQSQFDRFNEGEILVTGMTRPEFVPLMKKAAAIVTNEGGITCHAAIVSRELGKPCIIGTKNATTLIPDGAMIEVRANHGTVRVLT